MRLHAGAVHVWRADLDAVGAGIGRLLDERERERAARVVREPARRRWIAARGLLRLILGAYTAQNPSALGLGRQPHGKPVLAPATEPSLHFNLSHSGAHALYALTEMCAVGVDVELVRCRHGRAWDRTRELALAQRLLGPGGAERLSMLEPPLRRRELLRAWVRYEAEGKRVGAGVKNTPVLGRIVDTRAWIAELELGEDAVGAIAMASKPVDFRVYEIDFAARRSILQTGTSLRTPTNRTFPSRSERAGVPMSARERLWNAPLPIDESHREFSGRLLRGDRGRVHHSAQRPEDRRPDP